MTSFNRDSASVSVLLTVPSHYELSLVLYLILGVAFEQGKFLPTPETVPFRLTRDMVDGMGLTGVEGVYRRCCEKTMEVMRTSQESLMTVVEVRYVN